MDGRSLDEDSAKAIDMMNEKMRNIERSTLSWECDVYSQVLGNEKVPNTNCGLEHVSQTSRTPSDAENTLPSH
ncbi:hypothetical protein HAX54_019520, partial [Datura stramonium]|nr:hypothetical protein [Datura stramonium]